MEVHATCAHLQVPAPHEVLGETEIMRELSDMELEAHLIIYNYNYLTITDLYTTQEAETANPADDIGELGNSDDDRCDFKAYRPAHRHTCACACRSVLL